MLPDVASSFLYQQLVLGNRGCDNNQPKAVKVCGDSLAIAKIRVKVPTYISFRFPAVFLLFSAASAISRRVRREPQQPPQEEGEAGGEAVKALALPPDTRNLMQYSGQPRGREGSSSLRSNHFIAFRGDRFVLLNSLK